MQKELQLYTASLYSDLFSENHLQKKKKVDLPKEKKKKKEISMHFSSLIEELNIFKIDQVKCFVSSMQTIYQVH